jgi:hypothetical protein
VPAGLIKRPNKKERTPKGPTPEVEMIMSNLEIGGGRAQRKRNLSKIKQYS